jgi:hypothetical protein
VPLGQLDLKHLEKLAAAGEPVTVPVSLLLSLIVKIEVLEAAVAALRAKLSKDSHNSSKPPSTDKSNPGGSPPRKSPQGAGEGGRKKPGGQAGHKGSTLGKSMEADRIVELARPEKCGCGQGLARIKPIGHSARQVHDLREDTRLEVTEYRAPVCQCPGCGRKNTGAFPPEYAYFVVTPGRTTLRELTYVEEELGQGWAGDVSALLPKAMRPRDNETTGGKKVGHGSVRKILWEYRSIPAAGLAINPVPERVPG